MKDVLGLTVVRSRFSVSNTVVSLSSLVEKAGLTVFADIDHAQNAARVGMSLRETRVLIFGSYQAGAPLMQINQAVGIDLPFKIIVWQDEDGNVWCAYNEPSCIFDRHQLGPEADQVGAAIKTGMQRMLSGIISEPVDVCARD